MRVILRTVLTHGHNGALRPRAKHLKQMSRGSFWYDFAGYTAFTLSPSRGEDCGVPYSVIVVLEDGSKYDLACRVVSAFSPGSCNSMTASTRLDDEPEGISDLTGPLPDSTL